VNEKNRTHLLRSCALTAFLYELSLESRRAGTPPPTKSVAGYPLGAAQGTAAMASADGHPSKRFSFPMSEWLRRRSSFCASTITDVTGQGLSRNTA
jgi:hypothetical protein